ncbi:MAG TPA: (d)CMP kinase [Candidatus Dormibacteraeota bacterium]|jgi:cytidylate kinase|nr:(d)CMP kinase [Candidatus Dormibacteraeota bacterium]
MASVPARVTTGGPGGPPVVTVDGPAGSGKSTLGRRLATALRLPFVDTGLFYRGVTVAAVRAGLDPADAAAAERLAASVRIELNTDPSGGAGAWTVRVDGEDAGEAARDHRNARLLATLSGMEGVRRALLGPQRRAAAAGAVAVGRDCGTVVFPDAEVKIYLDAAPEVRASRREVQLRTRGSTLDAAQLRSEVADRDARDSERLVAPLRRAAEAHVIDTGAHGIDEVVELALELCRRAGVPGC